jgi:hypothetical protein
VNWGLYGFLTLLFGGAAIVAARAAFEVLLDPNGPQAAAALALPWWFWLIVAVICFGLSWWSNKAAKKDN